jgi:cellobiose transport system permease protein
VRTQASPSTTRARGPRDRGRGKGRLERLAPYLFISPFFILFGIFGLFPFGYNVVVSFRHWQLDDPLGDGWSGLDNYRFALEDSAFWNSLYNTFGIYLLAGVPQLLLALILAGLLNRALRFQTIFRVGILLPYITPLAASTLIFGAVFANTDAGIANYMLSFFGVEAIDWRADRWTSWLAISIMLNWKWIGYNAIIYLAAMQSIPKDLYEAATLDGARHWQQFWRITVPLIRPAILFTVILNTIGQLQLFTEPLLFDTNVSNATGGFDGQFQTVALLIYKTGWKDLDLGLAAAMSVILFVIVIVLAAFNAVITNRIGGRQ